MKVENIHVYGIMDALRGMRNPLNSWDKNDSKCLCDSEYGYTISVNIGENDKKLCKTLAVAGSPHRKYLRQIFCTMDIVAPTYWWAEMDTYKINTTRNSCSVQHKGASRDFVLEDFTIDGLTNLEKIDSCDADEASSDISNILKIVNKWRKKYVESGKTNYNYFRIMREMLPTGYDYRTTWSGNYENLLNIYYWRHNHKLSEWHILCDEIKKMPMMEFLIDNETK